MAGKNPILDVPAEIRLMIYRLAIIKRLTGHHASPPDGFVCSLVPPPLARVNRLLRQEVIHEYYTNNEFWIQLPLFKGEVQEAFHSRFKIASPFIPMIRSLRAEIYPGNNATWSIVFEATTPESVRRVDFGPSRRLGTAFYWRILAKMLNGMTLYELSRYGGAMEDESKAVGINHLVVSDALYMLVDRSSLADLPLQAVFYHLR
ncbi:hypothetical protein F5Y12DRAFT_791728 [Xylaria sp. FL1777]|nr:hypothetical protein F5Y12DRAFT_791728 [Xylaria sp. FL1777]